MSTRFISHFRFAAFLLAIAMVSPSMGQERRQRGGPPGFGGPGFGAPGGFGFGLMSLATRPEVQEALGLTADEKEYVKLIEEGSREAMREAMENLEPSERFTKMREIFATQAKETEKQLSESLGKDKLKRLKEIEVQVSGTRLLMDPNSEVAKSVGVDEEQLGKLREAAMSVEEELQEIRRQKMEEKLMGILSSSQQSKWKELTGEPITFKLQPRQRGDGDGRPRGEGRRRPDSDN